MLPEIKNLILKLSSGEGITYICLKSCNLNDDDIICLMILYKERPDLALTVTHINLQNNKLKGQLDLSCFLNIENVCLQGNRFSLPPILPANNKVNWLNLSENPIEIAPHLLHSKAGIKVHMQLQSLTIVAKFVLKEQCRKRQCTLNNKSGDEILTEVTSNNISELSLRQHFSILLKHNRYNYNAIFSIALILASSRSDGKTAKPLMQPALPAVLNARILSYLYQPQSLDQELAILLELLPQAHAIITAFASSKSKTALEKIYQPIVFTETAERLVSVRKKQRRTTFAFSAQQSGTASLEDKLQDPQTRKAIKLSPKI